MATFARRHPPPAKRRPCVNYRAYRQEVREDFNGYCGHCGVHEDEWDHGEKNYVLDHFRPKGQRMRGPLNDYYNLYWCCHVCNRGDAKGEHWPSAQEESMGLGFVDLCIDEWQDHYEILLTGILKAKTVKASYTIDRIGLNNDDYVRQRLGILKRGGNIFPPIPTLHPTSMSMHVAKNAVAETQLPP